MSKAPKPNIKKVQTLLLEVVDTNRLLREKMRLPAVRRMESSNYSGDK